ncbi:zinc finger protein 774-like, partial [Frankliniella occidentalis]|uniref:Zinc finger protein 774-like n=1 Tax=Frankliniella occidentalis TaxID=133901 RepID=A0A9C6X8E8_FRAOC
GALVAGRDPSRRVSPVEDPGEASVDDSPALDELKQEDGLLGLVVTACFSLQDEQCPAEAAARGGSGVGKVQPGEGPWESKVQPKDISGDGEVQPEQRDEEVAPPPGDAISEGGSTVRYGTRDAQSVQNERQRDEKASPVLRKKQLGRKYTGSGSGGKSNTSGALQANSRGCTGRAFKCEVCRKSFGRASHLKTHNMYHNGEKPFSCDLCPMRFTQKCTLGAHMRTHTGEKPFKCDVCNMSFTEKGNLVRHLRTHTGEKPYKCDKCKMRFTQNNHLVTHMRTHTGEKPYQCGGCNKQFSDKSNLNAHKRTCKHRS